MDSEIKLKFGKHKGRMLKDVPNAYLEWCVINSVLKGKAMFYAKNKIDYPKDKYEVTVEDAVVGDGKYIVEAYDANHAITVCKRQNHIQITQSFCGTSFSTVKL